ncbi:hypothetical protein FNV43_RR15446 [Rhamnella rubrinervis]|uniref:Uncharacterized protein n=1 Tax=Rhamnella rubrinervis TaxID=2594499 RepID=A0A8K0ECT1_9ROSA|nr:hypothetical protein FNV43_RR15446 [Rhamnella rubrinervis]
MGFEDNIEKMQLRQEYRNFWHTELMKTMTKNPTCTPVVLVTCHAVVNVEKVNAPSFAFALRFGAALETQSPQHAFYCKMNSISRPQNVIIALLVCSCTQTQHQIEMDKRDGKLGGRQAPEMGVPPIQQMSRIDQPIPPSAGYPPQPGYGPYGYPYPPQAQGYPNAGYPPPPTYTNDQYTLPNHHPTYTNDQYPPLNYHPTYTNDQYPPPSYNPK